MQILPILSTLRRHRTAATLIVLQIALTCAIICNVVFIIGERLGRMNRETGIVEDEIVRISLTGIGKNANAVALSREDLAALAAIPGVRAAALTNQIPLNRSSWNSGVEKDPNQTRSTLNASTYFGSEDLVETLGVQLIAGRDFNRDEYVQFEDEKAKAAVVIISRAMSERLFPGQSGVGQTLYIGEEPKRVIGIVDRLIRPVEVTGPAEIEYSVIAPTWAPYTIAGNYLLRVDPARRGEILAAAATALERNGPNRILLDRQTYAEIRQNFFREDRAMAWLLVAVSVALLVITALGIVGLASFWVQQRTKQIGIRRALGATRRQVLRYFQTENFLLATLGIVLGMALAYGMNLWLMERYELPRLPVLFLPLGAVALWLLGQVAVLGPALRAAAVPPAVATRTV